MHNAEFRARCWQELNRPWDLVVIGGGITGAGIFREAARWGLRVLLVEQGDFASGTSSRSSKLVHGGLRYLATGEWRLTLESVRERQRLLREAPGLVEPLGFVSPVYEGERPGRREMRIGLAIYDAMAGRRQSSSLSPEEVATLIPQADKAALSGGVHYLDAQTDDARLVWRLLLEGMDDSTEARALNYVQAVEPLVSADRITGVLLRNMLDGAEAEVHATAVINAAGVWCERLSAGGDAAPAIRPLRGSHLVFPFWRLPLAQAATRFHPQDRRPMFALPWEGITLFGTTDLDHADGFDAPPRMTEAECRYLMQGLHAQFPSLNLKAEDAIASYAGVRPVIAGGAADPSSESREHAIWEERGMLMVAGGKLTTFRRIALEALGHFAGRIAGLSRIDPKLPVLRPVAEGVTAGTDPVTGYRLRGRYGVHAQSLITNAKAGEMDAVGPSVYRWAELRHAARSEAVCHLDDLLLRRTRIGLTLPDGGERYLDRCQTICLQELGWDQSRWQAEHDRYRRIWQSQHAVFASKAEAA